MIYIIEGADGTGKSTFVQEMKDRGYKTFDTKLLKSTDKRNMPVEWWFNIFEQGCEKDIFIDRSFISDMVYRYILGGKTEYLPSEWTDLLFKAKLWNIQVVHFEHKDAWDRCLQRGEDLIKNRKQHQEIEKRYKDIMYLLKEFFGITILTEKQVRKKFKIRGTK